MKTFFMLFVLGFATVSAQADTASSESHTRISSSTLTIDKIDAEKLTALLGATVEVISEHTNALGQTTVIQAQGVVHGANTSKDARSVASLRLYKNNGKTITFHYLVGTKEPFSVQTLKAPDALTDFKVAAKASGLRLRVGLYYDSALKLASDLRQIAPQEKVRVLYLKKGKRIPVLLSFEGRIAKIPTDLEIALDRNSQAPSSLFQFTDDTGKAIDLSALTLFALSHP